MAPVLEELVEPRRAERAGDGELGRRVRGGEAAALATATAVRRPALRIGAERLGERRLDRLLAGGEPLQG